MTSAQTQFTPGSVISIYQNEDHVAGLLQQMFRAGLMTEYSQEETAEASGQRERDAGVGAKLGFKAKLPAIGEVEAGLDGSGRQSSLDAETQGLISRRQYVFSQAYYLYHVRNYLQTSGLLKTIDSASSAADMAVGDFVEFSGTFTPNEVTALLDVFSPEMVSEIVRYGRRKEAIAGFDAYPKYEERKAYMDSQYARADAEADLAASITRAVRDDFRSHDTREFYARLGTDDDSLTAVAICEAKYFQTADMDRILDGQFTVLGKVSSEPTNDAPLLSRNKVLHRANPELFDWLVKNLSSLADETTKIPALDQLGGGEDFEGKVFDARFTARLRGPSFKVVPVAIYV